MEKRKLRILTVVVFAGVLIFGALRENSTGRGELGEIQVAMWNLGKVDNLQLLSLIHISEPTRPY